MEFPRVLVVDDEEAIRNALMRFLHRQRYPVLAASGGEQALGLLAEHPDTALMLSDIRMPGMSGMDLVPKALAANPDLGIVMLTAVEDPTTAIECMKLGAYDYLIKPVDLDELRIQIEQALRRRRLEMERRDLEAWLAREVAEQTSALEETSGALQDLAVGAFVALVDRYENAADVRPRGRALADLAARISTVLGLDDDRAYQIALAAHLTSVRDIPALSAAFERFATYSPVWDLLVGDAKEGDLVLDAAVVRGAQLLAQSGMEAVERELVRTPDVIRAARSVSGAS